MKTLLILYFANLLLDYPLQGEYLAIGKGQSNYLLFVHSSIWGLGITVVLMLVGLFAWWKVIMLVVGHFVIDYLKCRGFFKVWRLSEKYALYLDQALHIIQIAICI